MIRGNIPGQDLDDFLESSTKRPGETVLSVIATSPTSTLIVTNLRLISQVATSQSEIFSGSLDYENINAIHYVPGFPILGAPRLEIDLKQPTQDAQRLTFQLPGRLLGALYFWSVDFNPHQIYELILNQLVTHNSV